MKDLALEAYVEAIEAHLRARQGLDRTLAGPDFALARSWFERGVPLAAVLVGIDDTLDASDVHSLRSCRRRVEALAASATRPPARVSAPEEQVPLPELLSVLRDLRGRLEALPPARGACFSSPLRRIHEVEDLVSVAARPNWDYLRGKLREIDDDVSAAAMEALAAEELAALRQEAHSAAARHRGRVDRGALADAEARLLLFKARERLGLPRVSLV